MCSRIIGERLKVCFVWKVVAFVCCTGLSQCCPENCFCTRNQQNVLTARCRLDTDRDYSLLRHLPSDVTELECHVKEPFMEKNFNTHHLVGLEKLVLRPDKFSRAGSVSSKTGRLGFQNLNIFGRLTKLKHLGINLSLLAVNPNILLSLEHLQVLDLSHTEGLGVRAIVMLLQGISVARLPLVTLNLTKVHIRGIIRGTEYEPLNLRTDVYQHLKSIHTLRILDIRENGVVQKQAGLSEFLPNLEELYLGENIVNYFPNGLISSLCSAIDKIVHPALRKFYYSVIPGSECRIHKRAFNEEDLIDILRNGWNRCSRFSFDICGLLNCICKNETRFNCSFVDAKRILLAFKRNPKASCVGDIQIPLPVNLEQLIVRVAPGAMSARQRNRTQKENYCFLPDNKLSLLDVSSSNLDYTFLEPDLGVKGLSHLATVNLEFNYIDLLKTSTWFKGSDIKTLLLSGNTLVGNKSHFDDFFVNFPDLEILKLSQCRMTNTPSFEYLTKLKEVDISQNDLTAFTPNLGSLNDLRKMDLRDNKISSLPDHVTDALNRMADNRTVTIDLSGNPLLCQCHTLEFVSWMQSKRVTFSNNDSLLCRTRSGALVSPWDIDLNEEEKICSNFYPIIYSIVACVLVIVPVAVSLVLYRKQWTLRFWIHAARQGWRRRKYQRLGRENRQYKYDAFIAYCSRDTAERQWVHLTFVPKLETDYGLKMCIHHRDFLPGIDIQDNIVDAINSSRKTVLVLSPSFLDSGWCNFEVRMAKVKLVEERRDSIVLVLYKPLDIPGTRIPKTLMNLLDRKTYAEWTTEPAGQELFWNKLVSVLREDVPQPEAYDGLDIEAA